MRITIDPGATTGLVLLSNPYPVQGMWSWDITGAFSLVRFAEGVRSAAGHASPGVAAG